MSPKASDHLKVPQIFKVVKTRRGALGQVIDLPTEEADRLGSNMLCNEKLIEDPFVTHIYDSNNPLIYP